MPRLKKDRGSAHRWRLLALAVAAWAVSAWIAARALLPAESDCDAPADVILVLAGARAYPERARLAAELFHAGAAPRILLTNDGRTGSYLHSERRNPWMVERTAWALQEHGVPTERIEILPEPVASTRDEAELLSGYAARRGLKSVLVVTSGYHVRRAHWIFEQWLDPAPTRVLTCGTSPAGTMLAPPLWWLTPAGWDAVAGEYVRTIVYRLLYRRAPGV